MNGASMSVVQQNIEKLKQLFPEAISEGKIDWERLRTTLGEEILSGNERYVLNWAGKLDAFKAIQTPTSSTLLPAPEASIDFEKSHNIFIEGENLEVLRILQKSYYNKIKCVIIDPPYNTGGDRFVYPDKFAEKKEEYLKRVGEIDEEGLLMREGLLRKNSKENGHFHSNWLSMIYPRLFLAKNLLKDDGIIFVHIDDNEVHNLRLVLNELFGEENFIAEIVWEGAIKNDSKLVSLSHDYILCFAKNKPLLTVNDQVWRTRKEGLDEIYEKVEELKKQHAEDFPTIGTELREWYASLAKNNPSWVHRHYSRVDKRGVYFPGDISWPGGGGPRYEILHPITEKPVRVPLGGWRFPDKKSMQDMIDEDRVDFGEDELKVPTLKRYLHEIEGQVLPSVIYKDRRAAMQRLRQLFGADVFENPKDELVLAKLLEASTKPGDIILDFFGGSAATAHAVFELNKNDVADRHFIVAQMAEPCDTDSIAWKEGYTTIAEISKERIRRVIKKINAEKDGYPDLFSRTDYDFGFKVFKAAPSNFKVWRPESVTKENIIDQMDAFIDPVETQSGEMAIVYELMIKMGFELSAPVESLSVLWDGKQSGGKYTLHIIGTNEMIVALDAMNDTVIEDVLERKPKTFLTLDSLFENNDQLKTNAVLQMQEAGIVFRTV